MSARRTQWFYRSTHFPKREGWYEYRSGISGFVFNVWYGGRAWATTPVRGDCWRGLAKKPSAKP